MAKLASLTADKSVSTMIDLTSLGSVDRLVVWMVRDSTSLPMLIVTLWILPDPPEVLPLEVGAPLLVRYVPPLLTVPEAVGLLPWDGLSGR